MKILKPKTKIIDEEFTPEKALCEKTIQGNIHETSFTEIREDCFD